MKFLAQTPTQEKKLSHISWPLSELAGVIFLGNVKTREHCFGYTCDNCLGREKEFNLKYRHYILLEPQWHIVA